MTSRVTGVLAFAAVGIAAAALVVALTRDTGSRQASSRLEGSGVAKTVVRSLPAFSQVELAGVGSVRVHPGSPRAVTISGDDNIVPIVSTRVEGGTLVIDEQQHTQFTTKRPLVIEIRAPGVTGSSLTGMGELSVEGVAAKAFTASLSGTGTLDVGGTAASLAATMDGTGAAQLEHLVARDARVSITGTGSAHVFVTHSLDATVDGMGSVVYDGNPPQVTKNVTGLGSVTAEAE